MMFDILDLRKDAYPFDWLWNLNHGLAAVNEIIESRFAQILDPDSYVSAEHPRLARNSVLYRSFRDIIHLHSDPMNRPEDHATIVRRILRFNEMLRGKDHLHFIYYANLNERHFFTPELTASGLVDEMLSEGKRFMSFMSRKGHGKRTTLLLILQADVEILDQVEAALSGVDSGDERIRFAHTISRVDSSPELARTWRRQWTDAITNRTDMPDDMAQACRLRIQSDFLEPQQ